MKQHEGWSSPTPKNLFRGSRSWRNNNPGNLRYSPFQTANISGYAFFDDPCKGFAAFLWDLRQKCTGNTSSGLNGESTIQQLIFKWAPKEDGNDPQAYLNDVIANTGLSPDTKLNTLV